MVAAVHGAASVSSKPLTGYLPTMSRGSPALHRSHAIVDLGFGGLALLLLAGAAWHALGASPRFVVAATVVYLLLAALLAWRLPAGVALGAANRVTLGRAVLVCLLAAALVDPEWLVRRTDWLVGVALVALAADGLDGAVARRTGTQSAFGARFDMELDAALILVLCLCVAAVGKAGVWVLAIGGMRYAFVAAMWPCPWLAAPLPERWRRKAVCVWQVASLVIALSPPVTPAMAVALLGSALALLAWSFAVDIRWLHRASRSN